MVAVSITGFGAVGDGVTNNQDAIQAAFNYAAANGDSVLIPAGSFAYSGTLVADGIAVSGDGVSSLLTPLDPTNEALTLTGSGASVSNLALASQATTRLSTLQSSMIWIDGATDFAVEGVTIYGSSSVGIFDDAGTNGLIAGNTVENTLADGITNSNGATGVVIQQNLVQDTGDDGISIVSYSGQQIVQAMTIQGNTVLNNTGGRGISVVGGTGATISNNYVQGGPSGEAGIYLAAEAGYMTQGVSDVTVSGNTLIDAGGSAAGTGQGAITVYNSEGRANTVTGVTITGNQIVDPLSDAYQFVGNGAESVTAEGNAIYTARTTEAEAADPVAKVAFTGDQLIAPDAYAAPIAAPDPTVAIIPASLATVAVSAISATIQATSGNQAFIILGNNDTLNLGGGLETIDDRGTGGNFFNLPPAASGSFVFSASVALDGDQFGLQAVMAATQWDGALNDVGAYLHVRQTSGNTELLVSATASRAPAGTLLATFDNTSLSLAAIVGKSLL